MNDRIVLCVKYAITITKIDFAVIEGIRSVERQAELVAKGASQTMKSKHIDGFAVDLAAYIGNRLSWEHKLYADIAESMKAAAQLFQVPIRWGAAWHISDISKWEDTMEEAAQEYIEIRISQGRKPFIDSPHFEINE